MGWRIVAGVGAALVVALVLLAQCGADGASRPTLRYPLGSSGGSAGEALPRTIANRAYYLQIGEVCVAGGKRVRITGARLIHPTGGERLTDVAVRRALWVKSGHKSHGHIPRKFYAVGAGRLSTYGFHSKVADMPCTKGGRTDQVAIQFERTDTQPPAIAHSDAVRLLYGDGRSLVLRFEPVLCTPKVHTRETC